MIVAAVDWSGITLFENPPLVAFYVFYFLYFVIGAAQIYLGYERSPPKDSLKQFTGVYPVLFKYGEAVAF